MKPIFLSLILAIVGSMTAKAGWLPREIHSVRAYVYDYTQEEKNPSLLKSGRLHKGVINADGAVLSKPQIERLKNALKSSKERVPGAFCYEPHHGFVFYDRKGTAMGYIELCFRCRNVKSWPRGLPEQEWDWKEIALLLKEVKVPILDKAGDYTKLYNKSKAKKAR